MGTFCLAASHQPGTKQGRALLEELIADPPKKPRVCIVGAAHGDDRSRLRSMTKTFQDIGFQVDAPKLSDPRLDPDEARAALAAATLLYLDGGDTLELVRFAKHHALEEDFAAAGKSARLTYGLSAGACACSPFTIGYDDDGNGFVAPCLDMGVHYATDVHDEDEWPEMRALLELVERDKGKKEAVGIVIPTGAALIVGPRGGLRSWGPSPCEKRRLENGEWVVEKIA